MIHVPTPLRAFNWKIVALLFALAGFGLVVLFSAASGSPKWAMPQGVRLLVFLGGALALSRVREEQIKQAAYPAFLVVLALLLAVFVFGGIAGGSRRWLDVGIRLQPSELMKLAVVLAVARFYERLPTGEIRGLHALWPPALMIGIPFALVLVQPDLGTASMIALGGIVVIFLAGVPLRLFAGAVGVLAAALPIAWTQMHDYQRKRVMIFIDPESDPLGAGYHITQSKIAIGSGGVFGKGFLNGTQSHLNYLPEGHTDFVFATMAEEWGLAGGLFVIAAYLVLIRWGMRVAANAPTRFGQLAAAGLITTIFFYFAINLMMVMGLAPVVGIPLPLVSFGGSAMMTVLICIGLLMSIERSSAQARRRGDF